VNPYRARRQLERAVQVESGGGCATRWCCTENFARFDIDAKMIAPTLLARMKEGNFFLSCFIARSQSVALAQAAR
jgi:hypothetical protein